MKKYLTLLLAFFCAISGAQTFPVQNLQVNGTSSLGGTISGAGLKGLKASVTNLAALRSLNHLYYSQASTQGYSTPSDNGGASYYLLANSTGSYVDDGGSIIVANDGAVWGLVNAGYVTPEQFGADNTGTAPAANAINGAIQFLALGSCCGSSGNNGGTVNFGYGTFNVGSGTVLLPSNITLNLQGAYLNGNGSNTLIASAAIIGGVLTNIVPQYGTGPQGAGTQFVGNAQVIGGHLGNAAICLRGHRLNYGANIQGVTFNPTCAQAWLTTHSWGLSLYENTVYAPAVMQDFVDWTSIQSNSFEGPGSTTAGAAGIGLTITTGGYGGSYSAAIRSNGFHHWRVALTFTSQGDDTIIEGNHFEDNANLIVGDANTRDSFRIKNNWLKANLATAAAVTAINFAAINNSEIGPNFFSTDGASTWASEMTLNTTSTYGNLIYVPYSLTSTVDTSLYAISDNNTLNFYGGSNNATTVQPTVVPVSGSSGYTVEKYIATYHRIANTIPNCVVTYTGTTATIDTQIPSDADGVEQMVMFQFKAVGTTTYIISGFFNRLNVSSLISFDKIAGTAGPTPTISNNGGFARITITGLASGGNIVGEVKAM